MSNTPQKSSPALARRAETNKPALVGDPDNSRESTECNNKTLSGDESFPEPMAEPAFYGLAGAVVEAIAPLSESSKEALLVQFLVAVGNLVGRNAMRYQGKAHHCNEFVVIAGNTSKARKGTSWDNIALLLQEVEPEWAFNRIQDGFPSGESIVYAVRDEKFSNDGEKTLLDAGVKDKRLLIHEGEFAGLLARMSRENNTMSARLRDVWDGNQKIHNNGKGSPDAATGAHVSMICHITRADINKHLRDVDTANGLANRVLWVATHRRQKHPFAPRVEWSEVIKSRLRRVLDVFSIQLELDFDAATKKTWEKWYMDQGEGGESLIDNLLARDAAHILRLSMIYAVLDSSALIQLQHFHAALAVWDYCARSVKWIFGNSTGDKLADKILYALEREPKGLSTKEASDLFNRNVSKPDLSRALELLVSAGKAKMVKVPGKTKPTTVFYDPKFEDTIAEARQEEEESESVSL